MVDGKQELYETHRTQRQTQTEEHTAQVDLKTTRSHNETGRKTHGA